MKYQETAKRLRNLMNQHNMNAKTLSEKSGVGKASISHYVNGTHTPSSFNAYAIAQVFNVNPVYLMGLIDDETPLSANPIINDIETTKTINENPKAYYLDDDAQEAAQFLFENPEYKVLFDASRKVKPEDIDFVKQMIEKLSK